MSPVLSASSSAGRGLPKVMIATSTPGRRQAYTSGVRTERVVCVCLTSRQGLVLCGLGVG